MVDQVTAGKLRWVRLLRASPGGVLEMVAAWPRLGLAESYFLSIDHDGSVLLSLARAKGSGFVTALP